MGDAIAHLATAINNHDLEAFVALFAADYRSEQPAHPSRSFRGVDQVRENRASVFAGIPDLGVEFGALATNSRRRRGGRVALVWEACRWVGVRDARRHRARHGLVT